MRNFVKRWTRVWTEKKALQGTARREASAEQVRDVFQSHWRELADLALFLTGRPALADMCLKEASASVTQVKPAFLEWVEQWARHATVKSAIRLMHTQIMEAARSYEHQNCHHQHHSLPAAEIANAFHAHRTEADRLDAFARFALVLRGLEHHSRFESGLWLGVGAAQVEAAYCAALKPLGLEESGHENALPR